MQGYNLDAPENYINRELSSLAFNLRVLEEAQDTDNPLLERAKFASIVSTNLDEFFMVRVAAVWDQLQAGLTDPDEAGLTPQQVWDRVSKMVHLMIADLYSCYSRSLRPGLKKQQINLSRGKKLDDAQKAFLDNYYLRNVFPVLTPMVVDSSRPFPLLLNRSLNIAVLLENPNGDGEPVFATVQVPSVLDRMVSVPSKVYKTSLVFLEEIIKSNLPCLFNGHRILATGCFRITRNADLSLDEEGAEDLLEALEQSVKQRKWGEVIRLEYEKGLDSRLVQRLIEELELPEGGLYEINGPLDLSFLMKIATEPEYDHLRFPPFRPQIPAAFDNGQDIFGVIARQDILVHHPYESFQPIVHLVQTAAEDPDVLAIKQILYRVSGNSPIVAALERAAENGKQVTVLVELKARFDEEKNITWAKRLEKAGCHVIYGLPGLKVHAKMLLIVRQEEDGIKRYLHLGTGNYNDVTARTYEDLGLFTANARMAADASTIFNMLSGYSNLGNLYELEVAPMTLRQRLSSLIRQEIEHARNGRPAHIIAKVNSLLDKPVIKELFMASQAGVRIDLIVRGICSLKPNVPGCSENIQVRSVVGRFLEHSRIYFFHNDGDNRVFLSSADLMTRNLDRRIEIMFPVEDEDNKTRIKEILDAYLRDTVKARILKNDSRYYRIDKRGKKLFNSQLHFCRLAQSGPTNK
ncbi:MAG TPA: RNA degradosome polyphosphate kinase [Syntrophomonadaceae bacterium]|nr:RNA degradosome polyphosphate kinase [Syntrophomonadaceae bacterium]